MEQATPPEARVSHPYAKHSRALRRDKRQPARRQQDACHKNNQLTTASKPAPWAIKMQNAYDFFKQLSMHHGTMQNAMRQNANMPCTQRSVTYVDDTSMRQRQELPRP